MGVGRGAIALWLAKRFLATLGYTVRLPGSVARIDGDAWPNETSGGAIVYV
jgi:hypothetical protein